MEKKKQLTFGRLALYIGVGIIIYVLVKTIFEINSWL